MAGGVRTAYIERARAGASGNHYTFSSNGGAINLIWAKGGTSFGNHGGSNRGFASINLVDQCNIPNTVLGAQNICQGDSVQVFGEWIKQSGIYYDSLSTPLGCDSIVEQQVLVNNTINNTIASTGLCVGDSVFYLDAWRTDTGTVVYNGVTALGCDSIVTGRVEYLPTVDTGSIWVAPFTDASFYIGLDTGATYYWFNCNTGAFVDTTMGADTLNPGNEFLQAPDTGFYAAIIVKPGYCSDTSACYYFYMDVPEYDYGISLRPIPTQKDLEITIDDFTSPVGYQLLSVSGKVLATGFLRSNSTLLDVRHYAAGMYLLRLDDGRTMKWMKE